MHFWMSLTLDLYCCSGHLSLQLKAQATQAAQMSASTVKSAIDAGLAAWSSYDKDGVSFDQQAPTGHKA